MGIACGQIYHTSVVSSDGYCESPPTLEVNTPSGREHHKMTENKEKNTKERIEQVYYSPLSSLQCKSYQGSDGLLHTDCHGGVVPQ